MNISTISGVKEVVNNLRRKDAAFRRGIELGLARGGLLGLRLSKVEVPVEFGLLRNSGDVRQKGKGFACITEIVYTAAYAGFVHEKVKMSWKGKLRGVPDAEMNSKGKWSKSDLARQRATGHKGRYWDPQGKAKAKFLEDPVYNNQTQIANVVRDTVYRYVFLRD